MRNIMVYGIVVVSQHVGNVLCLSLLGGLGISPPPGLIYHHQQPCLGLTEDCQRCYPPVCVHIYMYSEMLLPTSVTPTIFCQLWGTPAVARLPVSAGHGMEYMYIYVCLHTHQLGSVLGLAGLLPYSWTYT